MYKPLCKSLLDFWISFGSLPGKGNDRVIWTCMFNFKIDYQIICQTGRILPFYIPASSVGRVSCSVSLPTLDRVSLLHCHPFRGVWRNPILVFNCISLTTNNLQDLFICLSAICVSLLAKGLFKCFAHFSIGLVFSYYYCIVKIVCQL